MHERTLRRQHPLVTFASLSGRDRSAGFLVEGDTVVHVLNQSSAVVKFGGNEISAPRHFLRLAAVTTEVGLS